ESRRLLRDQGLDLALRLVGFLADSRALGGGNGAERAQESGQVSRASQHADADLFDLTRGAGPGDVCQGPFTDRLNPRVTHSASPGVAPPHPALSPAKGRGIRRPPPPF